MSGSLVHVAVGVIRGPDNKILIAQRHPDSHQGGLWEFPGGKVEKHETVEQALARELSEELGLTVDRLSPLMEIKHDYPDKSVYLDVWWVESFSGAATGCEGQPLRWVTAAELSTYTFPEANKSIVSAIQSVSEQG